jgi:hypothetical protein
MCEKCEKDDMLAQRHVLDGGAMAIIEIHKDGTTVIHGKGIDLFQLLALRGILKMNLRGLNTRNFRQACDKTRELLGLPMKARNSKVDTSLLLDALEDKIAQMQTQVTRRKKSS